MRLVPRLAVASATAALAASVVLAGAGTASARNIVVNSANTVSVSGTTVTLTNRTDTDLQCIGVLTTPDLVAWEYRGLTTSDRVWSREKFNEMNEAIKTGYWGTVLGSVKAGKTGVLDARSSVGATLKNGLETVLTCRDGQDTTYVVRSGRNVPPALDMGGTPGILTGSLGS